MPAMCILRSPGTCCTPDRGDLAEATPLGSSAGDQIDAAIPQLHDARRQLGHRPEHDIPDRSRRTPISVDGDERHLVALLPVDEAIRAASRPDVRRHAPPASRAGSAAHDEGLLQPMQRRGGWSGRHQVHDERSGHRHRGQASLLPQPALAVERRSVRALEVLGRSLRVRHRAVMEHDPGHGWNLQFVGVGCFQPAARPRSREPIERRDIFVRSDHDRGCRRLCPPRRRLNASRRRHATTRSTAREGEARPPQIPVSMRCSPSHQAARPQAARHQPDPRWRHQEQFSESFRTSGGDDVQPGLFE